MSERLHFQAEIQQLLDIVIHSLYTDREIFIRELVSNGADACERLRFLQSSGQAVLQPDVDPCISVRADEQEHTVTVADTGIGMTRAELVENLGTIAHSGTRAFLRQLAEEKRPDAKLIGQFGVGFYSAFMVASQVTVLSRSGVPGEPGWRWTSEGAGGYDIEPADDLPRGTQVIVHLKDDAREFARGDTVKRVLQRYSSFVQFPIELNGSRLNSVQAIWSRPKGEVKEDEYHEFYRYLGHDAEVPLLRLHFAVDAPLSIQALLFVPQSNWENLGLGRTEPGVNLYCRKVLIQSHAKNLLPDWLRFLKGVVDSEDLPLNISRETMQDSALMQKINKALAGRFLKFLEDTAEKDAGAYEKFYAEYQRFLKEGVATDFQHRESLGKLLRFESSAREQGKVTSLADYVARMAPDQKEVYYLLAPTRDAAEASPYFEVFKARGFEVLFLFDPWDEFVMEHLHAFAGKNLRPAEKTNLDLGDKTSQEGGLSDDDASGLTRWLKEKIGDRVNDVRVSKRLVDSPAVVLESDQVLTSSMRKILQAVKREGDGPAGAKPDLEINPRHVVITRLEAVRHVDEGLATMVGEQVFDNALVAAGLLDDPRTMLKRLNDLLERTLAARG